MHVPLQLCTLFLRCRNATGSLPDGDCSPCGPSRKACVNGLYIISIIHLAIKVHGTNVCSNSHAEQLTWLSFTKPITNWGINYTPFVPSNVRSPEKQANVYNMCTWNINVHLCTYNLSSTLPVENNKWQKVLCNNILTLEWIKVFKVCKIVLLSTIKKIIKKFLDKHLHQLFFM
jgi:hypothetical protein